MTNDEILSMAYDLNAMPETMTDEAMYRLVRAAVLAEREACAKVCEDLIENFAEHTCAAAIRSRGEK